MRFTIILLSFVISLGGFGQQLETSVQTGHYERIAAMAFTPDGKHLVSASEDMTMKLWEVNSGREIRTFHGPDRYVKRLAIHPSRPLMGTISMDGLVWVWNYSNGKVINQLRDTADVITNAIFTPDGRYLVTGGRKYTGAIWDAETLKLVQRLEGSGLGCGRGQCHVSLAIVNNTLLAGVQNYQVEIWDLKSFELQNTVKLKRGSCSTCTSIVQGSADKKSFFASTGDSLQLRSIKSGERLAFQSEVEDVEHVQVTKNGRYVANLERGTFHMLQPTGSTVYSIGTYPDGVTAYAFSPDGRTLATSSSDFTISIRETADGKVQSTMSGYINDRTDSLHASVKYWAKNLQKQEISPDGTFVLENIGGVAVLWEFASGRVIRKFKASSEAVIASRFSPDGKYVATGGGDRVARLWETQTGNLVREFRGQTASIFTLDFSPDGQYLVSGGWDYTMYIWNLQTGEIYGRYQPHDQGSPVEVQFVPGGIYLVSGGLDQRLVLTDVDTGKGVREFIGHKTHVVAIDFSPDNKMMLTGSWDHNAKLWDLATGLATVRYSGHTGPVYDVDFSTSGKWVATGSWDKTARVWTVEGELVHTFSAGSGAITSVNFTPDDRYLVTGSRDGSTRIWEIETGREVYRHVLTSEDDWLVTNPSGYFHATQNAMSTVYFVQGMQSFDVDQFFDQYYNPDVVEESFSAPAEEGSLLNSLQSSPPPDVEIISPEVFQKTSADKIEIVYKVVNNGGGVDEVRLTQNGKSISLTPPDLSRSKKGRSIFQTTEASLVPGYNRFVLSAFSDERIESSRKEVEVFMEGAINKPVCYLLTIGINKYTNTALNLNYARKDAAGFSKAVRAKGKSLFNEVRQYALYDSEASKENIFAAIQEIASKAGPNDVFFMYYAGHGSLVEEQFYFIPSEVVRLYEPDVLAKSAISASEMQEQLRSIKALKQLILLDACHSGGSAELLASRGSGEERALAQLSRSAGVHVLAAAGSQQTATEFEKLGHGLFTYLILEALNGTADGAPKDGKVTVYELRSYIDALVPEYSMQYKGAPQYPNTFSRGSDFPVVIHK